MKFSIHGPFKIFRSGGTVSLEKKHKNSLWDQMEDAESGLSYACGCYILYIRNTPWYVGLSEKSGFRNECLTIHKILHYNEALKTGSGVPWLLLVAKRTPRGRFAKPSESGYRDIQLIENLLIGAALGRNPNLRNAKNTKLLREMNVPGVLNSKQGQGRSSAVRKLRRVLSGSAP